MKEGTAKVEVKRIRETGHCGQQIGDQKKKDRPHGQKDVVVELKEPNILDRQCDFGSKAASGRIRKLKVRKNEKRKVSSTMSDGRLLQANCVQARDKIQDSKIVFIYSNSIYTLWTP